MKKLLPEITFYECTLYDYLVIYNLVFLPHPNRQNYIQASVRIFGDYLCIIFLISIVLLLFARNDTSQLLKNSSARSTIKDNKLAEHESKVLNIELVV